MDENERKFFLKRFFSFNVPSSIYSGNSSIDPSLNESSELEIMDSTTSSTSQQPQTSSVNNQPITNAKFEKVKEWTGQQLLDSNKINILNKANDLFSNILNSNNNNNDNDNTKTVLSNGETPLTDTILVDTPTSTETYISNINTPTPTLRVDPPIEILTLSDYEKLQQNKSYQSASTYAINNNKHKTKQMQHQLLTPENIELIKSNPNKNSNTNSLQAQLQQQHSIELKPFRKKGVQIIENNSINDVDLNTHNNSDINNNNKNNNNNTDNINVSNDDSIKNQNNNNDTNKANDQFLINSQKKTHTYMNHQQQLILPNNQQYIDSNDNINNSLVNKKNKQYNLDEITTSLNYYPPSVPNIISVNTRYNIKYRFEF
jgi:hypothetical protein